MTSIGAGVGFAEADLLLPKLSSIPILLVGLVAAAAALSELSAAVVAVAMTSVDTVTPSTLLCILSPFLLSFRTNDTELYTFYHLLLFPSPEVMARNAVVVVVPSYYYYSHQHSLLLIILLPLVLLLMEELLLLFFRFLRL